MVRETWIDLALNVILTTKVEHRNYNKTKRRVSSSCKAMFRGELFVLVGPTRVGKTRCVRDALDVRPDSAPDENEKMRVVLVEAGNESTSGEFSTKGFAMACLRAIHHPLYGVAAADDRWEQKLNELLDRTPERRLWSAFERALQLRGTEYLVIDEAHHVSYVRGGMDAAARVLDSWKCLANSTQVKLILTGSYELLSVLSLAPHLLGRQQPLEFARYRADSREDVEAWEELLKRFSIPLRFKDSESLSTWNRLLFDGSLGRTGGLSLWIRTALAAIEAYGLPHLTREILEATRLPAVQERAILQEIADGERMLLQHRSLDSCSGGDQAAQSTAVEREKASARKPRARKPGTRKPTRNPVNGRA